MAQHAAPGGRAARRLRAWSAVHTWSSLVCTVFLLVCCLTGLPLVFADELQTLLDDAPSSEFKTDAGVSAHANVDSMLADARRRFPDEVIDFVVRDDEQPVVLIGLRPDASAPPSSTHRLRFDAASGVFQKDIPAANSGKIDALALLKLLHANLLGGLAGGMFLAVIALLFLIAIVSGIVLYGPFAGKQPFGTIRTDRSARIRWLDLHNLLGITTMVWALIVGATGLFNELSRPLFAHWSAQHVKGMSANAGTTKLGNSSLVPLQEAIAKVEAALPGTTVGTILMPGGRLTPPDRYLLWAAGTTPLTSRMLQPVLVDAHTGSIAGVAIMPWYLRTLELSRPLHFGDYGGLPLKLLWAALDVITIIVLISGLILWKTRRKRPLPHAQIQT